MTSPTQKSKTWAASENRRMKERNFHPKSSQGFGTHMKLSLLLSQLQVKALFRSRTAEAVPTDVMENSCKERARSIENKFKQAAVMGRALAEQQRPLSRGESPKIPLLPSTPVPPSTQTAPQPTGGRRKNKCKQKSLDFTLVVNSRQMTC